jgi:phage terminase large subunit GpA-like protein
VTSLKPTTDARRKFFEALYPREKWTPSEWAEKAPRRLSPEETSEPGDWRNSRVPYLIDIMDAMVKLGVEEVVISKGAQVGYSECIRNVLGYWVDLDPGPALFVMPDQKSAEDVRDERIEPLIKNTPAVARHVSARASDSKKHRIRFDTMSLYFAWAGSSQGLKSRPIRYLLLEEPDEYPPHSGGGGDPIAKALKRITTYSDKGRARVLIGGTPTTRLGNIWKRWEMCPVRYHLWVPCFHCNAYQQLNWKQIKWPELKDEPDKAKRAARVEEENLAYYECEHCKGKILDHHKSRMLQKCKWASEDQVVTADGRIVGPEKKSKRIGFHLPSYYSPWVTFGKLAREWIEAQGDPQALMDFINQRLAEPFEEQRAKLEPDSIMARANGGPAPMIVPKWAKLLIATADTQGQTSEKGYFWYVIRAWGYDYRSQLVDFGAVSDFNELRERCLTRQIPMEGMGNVAPQILLVDSGGPRWQEVYQFAQSDPGRIKPTKGESYARDFMVIERPQKNHGIVLWKIDTEQAKDLLYFLIFNETDRTKWAVHSGANEDYCRQMCSEAKIFDPKLNRETWVEVVKNNNHFWDCEAMQCAAAWKLGCGNPEPALIEPSKPAESGSNPMNYRGKW